MVRGSLRACVGEVGFEATFTERLPLHGGLLRCGFRAVAGTDPIAKPTRLDAQPFEPLVDGYVRRLESPLSRTLVARGSEGKRLVAYGASGRANVWMNQMTDIEFEYVLDDSPLRMGRWLPHVAVPILPSATLDEDQPDVCLVTAWNYARSIRSKHPTFRGAWLQTFDLEPEPT